MAYKAGNRMYNSLLPTCIDDYVSAEDPVRVYDAFVEALNFQQLDITIEPFKAGADTYWPKQMVKLLVYGYSYGIRSSRKLERACHHNLSFIWLMGGLTPDYRTIARFRDTHKEALKNILKQSVVMCLKLDLIDGNSLFVDSTVIKANASLSKTWDAKRCQKYLEKTNEQIDRLIDESKKIDESEESKESLVKIKEQIGKAQQIKDKVEAVARELNSRKDDPSIQAKTFNTTDPQCAKIHKSHQTYAGYNVQMTVDEKHGLIVDAHTTDATNDAQQLSGQVQNAQVVLEHKPHTVCCDSGYYSLRDLEKIDQEITVIIPSQQQVGRERRPQSAGLFSKEHFVYDAQNDQYVCPEGKRLNHQGYHKEKQAHAYRTNGRDCQSCRHFGECTKSPRGRVLKRLVQEPLKEHLQAIYQSPEGQQIYALRKQKAELPFGHIKRNLSLQQFSLRGRSGTNAEFSLLSACFNLTRMMNLIGILKLKEQLQNFQQDARLN